ATKCLSQSNNCPLDFVFVAVAWENKSCRKTGFAKGQKGILSVNLIKLD
ncbi:unnamed protein product, partial [Heterotrigona itama]